MKKTRIILAVIIPLLFVSSGYYYLVTHPPQTHVKKEIVAMPVVYAGNLTYLYWGEEGVAYENDTPLGKYWRAEYLKTRTWSVVGDGINLTVYPSYVEGSPETEMIGFRVVLNSSRYIERVIYISSATEMAIKNGGFTHTELVDEEDYEDKREYWRELSLPGDPSVAEIESWHIGMSNVSFECKDYVAYRYA